MRGRCCRCAGTPSTQRARVAADHWTFDQLAWANSDSAGKLGWQTRFEPRPVGALDAHRAIHREAAVVYPGAHLGRVILVEGRA